MKNVHPLFLSVVSSVIIILSVIIIFPGLRIQSLMFLGFERVGWYCVSDQYSESVYRGCLYQVDAARYESIVSSLLVGEMSCDKRKILLGYCTGFFSREITDAMEVSAGKLPIMPEEYHAWLIALQGRQPKSVAIKIIGSMKINKDDPVWGFILAATLVTLEPISNSNP